MSLRNNNIEIKRKKKENISWVKNKKYRAQFFNFKTYLHKILTVFSHICSESSFTLAFNLKAARVSPSEEQQFIAVSPALLTSTTFAPRANNNILTAY